MKRFPPLPLLLVLLGPGSALPVGAGSIAVAQAPTNSGAKEEQKTADQQQAPAEETQRESVMERTLPEGVKRFLPGQETQQAAAGQPAVKTPKKTLTEEILAGSGAADVAHKIWTYVLFRVDGEAITIRKIVVALLVLVVGIFATRWFSRVLGERIFPRMGMKPEAGPTVRRLTHIFLLTIVIFVALDIAQVPLGVFAFVGGALAIGIGFGSQTLLNNFVSGIILLIERPIKQGDWIDVEGTYGMVENIGLRATAVRTPNNTHIVIPNSAFLEKNVLNWTLSDDIIRTSVLVGVAYGSPTRQVAQLIRKAVDEHNKILKNPKPVVLFGNFGDNSLEFEVIFWMHMKKIMDRRIIESDIRYRIDNLFREAGVTIAFPQRNVHLDFGPDDPIPVQVVAQRTGAVIEQSRPNTAESAAEARRRKQKGESKLPDDVPKKD